MKEEKKKSKKKVLLTYLMLAVCLLIIAAVTVTVIFTVNRNPDLSIDNPNQTETPNDGNKEPDNNPGNEGPNTPTDVETGYKIPVSSAVVTTRYEFAHNDTVGQYRVHTGIDFEGNAGDAVCAVLGGTVTKIVTGDKIGENYITISHADGVTSTYKYVEAKSGLKAGDTVTRGEIIGNITAASGYEINQGAHLHFEMNVNGKSADPEIYLDLVEK